MRNELEEVREAFMLADAALAGANMNMKVVERKVKKALATLDRILNQDEAEMAKVVAEAIYMELIYDLNEREHAEGYLPPKAAKAALRALGLLKEGV